MLKQMSKHLRQLDTSVEITSRKVHQALPGVSTEGQRDQFS